MFVTQDQAVGSGRVRREQGESNSVGLGQLVGCCGWEKRKDWPGGERKSGAHVDEDQREKSGFLFEFDQNGIKNSKASLGGVLGYVVTDMDTKKNSEINYLLSHIF